VSLQRVKIQLVEPFLDVTQKSADSVDEVHFPQYRANTQLWHC